MPGGKRDYRAAMNLGGHGGRRIGVKFPTREEWSGENQAVPLGSLNEARSESWNKRP